MATGSSSVARRLAIVYASSQRMTCMATHCEENFVSGRDVRSGECLKSSPERGIQQRRRGPLRGCAPGLRTFHGTKASCESIAAVAAAINAAASQMETIRIRDSIAETTGGRSGADY